VTPEDGRVVREEMSCRPRGAAAAIQFVVMTHNAGNGLAAPDRLVGVLRDSAADIIGLQELTVPQAEAIERDLTGLYPFRAIYAGGIPGKGLLSAYPLSGVEQLALYPGRPDLQAVLHTDNGTLTVIVAHPPPRNYRKGFPVDQATVEQIAALIRLAASGEPTILMGDFNATSRSATYARLVTAGLVDAYRATSRRRGPTLPARWARLPLKPMVRVDYIWHTAHFEAMESWIGMDTGSDHVPVLARLRFHVAGNPCQAVRDAM
jgi:endonuclease/exonuclease/phosphatase family metal-dependent hydrolase